MSTFFARAQNIAFAIETLKLIETDILAISSELSATQVENRVANAVAIYCAERTSDQIDCLGERLLDALLKGPI